MSDSILYKELSEQVIGCAITVHKELGNGFLEKVYENALCHEFSLLGIPYERQREINVFYKNIIVGTYIPDVIINNSIILELKAISRLEQVHFSQLINYLKATNFKVGYLLNFGASTKLEYKRLIF